MEGANPAEDDERQEREIKRLQRRIKSIGRQIQQAERRLAELTGEDESARADEAAEEDPTEIVVWGHDITVVPGVTYRYRFTVDLYNPFFAQKVNLLDSQHHLAERITLASRTSDWSAPRQAIPPLKVYVTRASRPSRNPGQLGMGQALAEVYRFFDGRWWRETFTVQPGDRVGGVEEVGPRDAEREVDFGTDWFVLDIIEDVDARRSEDERGWGATVVLMNLEDGGTTHVFDPRLAANDPERARLRDAVELAEATGGEVAAAN